LNLSGLTYCSKIAKAKIIIKNKTKILNRVPNVIKSIPPNSWFLIKSCLQLKF